MHQACQVAPVADAVDTQLIINELTPQRLLRRTNKGGNEIYVFTAHECPNAMREVGRLREIAFRAAGGGTGKDCDIDEYDLMTPPCHQLVVWDPEAQLILGAYRYILGTDVQVADNGVPRMATSHIFGMSERFVHEFLPYTIELGRSFVRVEYQSSRAGAKALYALDNLWDGLGALTVLHPQMKYLFGKMTMYPSYNQECRNMLLHFMRVYFPDRDNLVYPLRSVETEAHCSGMFDGTDFAGDYRKLNGAIRERGINIPPLINAYMNLSPSMRMFGTAVNDEFGNVEETAILVTINDIYHAKKSRHIDSFEPA